MHDSQQSDTSRYSCWGGTATILFWGIDPGHQGEIKLLLVPYTLDIQSTVNPHRVHFLSIKNKCCQRVDTRKCNSHVYENWNECLYVFLEVGEFKVSETEGIYRIAPAVTDCHCELPGRWSCGKNWDRSRYVHGAPTTARTPHYR